MNPILAIALGINVTMALSTSAQGTQETPPDGRSIAENLGEQLSALQANPDEGWRVIEQTWVELATDDAKRWVLRKVHEVVHPYAHRAMHLGATDTSLEVQNTAFRYLRTYALFDFAPDWPGYLAWHDDHEDQLLEEVAEESMRRFVGEFQAAVDAADSEAIEAILKQVDPQTFRKFPKATADALDAGLPASLVVVLTNANLSDGAISDAGSTLRELPLSDDFIKEKIAPLIESTEHDPVYYATMILGRTKTDWAYECLTWLLVKLRGTNQAERLLQLNTVAKALGEQGSPRAIPLMIGVIESDNTQDTIYGVGYFGLHWLTGVEFDESHDGAWWRAWWDTNKGRFPVEVQALEIPVFDPLDHLATEGANAHIPLHAGGDSNKQYFLMPPKTESPVPPPHGFKLLLVMPGGSGGADFHPFVSSIWREALADDYIIAQLVAPLWSEEQFNTIVWPTRTHKWEGMQFATEDFIDAVIDDVRDQYMVDMRCIFTLTWSSSGPAAYAASLADNSRITGSFIAMSVFWPQNLPDRVGAKGHAYYLYHSADDFIPMSHPETAKEELEQHGAEVTLVTYEGGHGWHGEVFADIREGIDWLEKKAKDSASRQEEEVEGDR